MIHDIPWYSRIQLISCSIWGGFQSLEVLMLQLYRQNWVKSTWVGTVLSWNRVYKTEGGMMPAFRHNIWIFASRYSYGTHYIHICKQSRFINGTCLNSEGGTSFLQVVSSSNVSLVRSSTSWLESKLLEQARIDSQVAMLRFRCLTPWCDRCLFWLMDEAARNIQRPQWDVHDLLPQAINESCPTRHLRSTCGGVWRNESRARFLATRSSSVG